MKVLGIVASPRRLGNSEILTKELLAMLSAQFEKEILRLPELDIRQCNACYACLPQEMGCTIRDDLGFFLDKVRAADLVVIASPCYFLGSHTSIKLVQDRLISILHNAREFSGKRCVTMITYGVTGWDGYAKMAVNSFARFLGLDVVGTLVVHAANPGEVIREDIHKQLQQLSQYLLTGTKPAASPTGCALCGNDLLRISADGTVHCPICGASGRLTISQQEYSMSWNQDSHYRFTPEAIEEHGKLLDSIKARYLKERTELVKLRKPYAKWDNLWVKK